VQQQYWEIGTLLQELQQHQELKLSVEVAYQVLLQVIEGEVPKKYRGSRHARTELSGWKQVLEQQPALTQQQVNNLLHLVFAPTVEGPVDDDLDLRPLLQLPAAQQLAGVEEVSMVLHHLYSHRNRCWCQQTVWCMILQQFPAIQQLPLEDVLQYLLWEAGKGSFYLETEKLAGLRSWLLLPVMQQQLTSEGAFQLLQAALGNTSAVEAVLTVPASQQMTLPQVLALLQGAIQKKDPAAFAILLKQLRAIKQLGVQQLHELMLLAVRMGVSSIADVMVEQLPEACQEMSAGQVKGLVAMGLSCMKNPLALLCLPAAADLPVLDLFHLLYMSARLGWGPLETLLKLPAAQQLDAEQVRCVLHAGLRAEDCLVALVLDHVPAAKQLTAATCTLLLPGLDKAADKLDRFHSNSWCLGRNHAAQNDMAKQQLLRLKSFTTFVEDKMLNSADGLQGSYQQRLGRFKEKITEMEITWQKRSAGRSW
jgi:hypothetical protein